MKIILIVISDVKPPASASRSAGTVTVLPTVKTNPTNLRAAASSIARPTTSSATTQSASTNPSYATGRTTVGTAAMKQLNMLAVLRRSRAGLESGRVLVCKVFAFRLTRFVMIILTAPMVLMKDQVMNKKT